MKVNTKTRYGLKALVYIANNSTDDNLIRIKEISEDTDLSISYLEQILNKLKNNNIIEGKRGPSGGYRLNKKPEDITVFDIFSVLEEGENLIHCDHGSERCHSINDCEIKFIWNVLDREVMKVLKGITLREVLEKRGKDVNCNC